MFNVRIAIACIAVLVPAGAQQLVHRSSIPTVPFTETDVLTPLTPLPDPTPNAATPRFAPLGGPGFPLGDLAMDNVLGRIWETDGFLLQATPNGRYASLAPPIPPTPSGLPPLTGLAVNPTAGLLYATDGVSLFTVLATPPFPLAAPTVPLGFPAIAPPFTGLDYNSPADEIYACDSGGFVYYFTTAGAPSGPNPVFTPPGAVPPATDIAAPVIVPGMYVQFLGLGVIDYTSGAVQPAPMTGIPAGTEGGLAVHAHPASLPGACACGGPAFGPMAAGVSAPSLLGAGSYGYTLTGGPPGSSAMIALDFTASPLAIGGGCTYWLPYPPFVLLTIGTSASGSGYLPLPLPVAPFLVGITVTAQFAAACPANPSMYVVSNALRSILALP